MAYGTARHLDYRASRRLSRNTRNIRSNIIITSRIQGGWKKFPF